MTTLPSSGRPDRSVARPDARPVAVVTGASQGLGLSLAGALADDGWALVVDARHGDRLREAIGPLAAHAEVIAVPGDVADPVHRAALVRAATQLGEVRLVVHNASTLGASPLPALDAIPADVLADVFAVNVIAPLALTQLLAPHLGPGATVVAVTSDAAVEAYEGWGGYGASKAALEHAHRVLAAEHREWRVLVVDPGDMRTAMHQDAFPGEDISDRPLPAAVAPGLFALIRSDRSSGRVRVTEAGS